MHRLRRPSEPPPRWLPAARHALLGSCKVSWHACIQAGVSTAINTQGFHAKSAACHHRPNCALQGTPPPVRASATPSARP
uniref:Gcu14 n=1 Tax=Pseudomonas aeruginosa TaxID=287 RepID=A0EL72_PSEAI|nr:Gcu14 [Pseudomonas aeruginosa]AKT33670.1 GCU14 [synthetic construct]